MKNDFKIIKDKYGENMAKLCRSLFPTLLEKDGFLSSLMLTSFAPNHFLYQDLVDQNYIEEFKNYILSFTQTSIERVETNKSVHELFEEAGYDFYECQNDEDIQNFEKYYQEDESLCTFRENRLEKCHVFFAVKKNVDQIKRDHFANPKREDEYGTSVISIQFSRGKTNVLSIKNRYNHTVKNPDVTFSNNLENIIPGLTEAFEREYTLNINNICDQTFDLTNYIKSFDGKYYKYNYEINNIYYCPQNIIIDYYRKVRNLDHSRYLLVDYFIFDFKEKKVYLYDKNLYDSFIDIFESIDKIEVKKENKNKVLTIKSKGKENIIINIDDHFRSIKLMDHNLEQVKRNFLSKNRVLQKIDCPNIKIIDDNFLKFNVSLEECFFPMVEKIGSDFLGWNNSIQKIYLPNVRIIKDNFLNRNKTIKQVYLPKVEEIGDKFLYYDKELVAAFLPSVKKIGNNFIYYAEVLQRIEIPEVVSVGSSFLYLNTILEEINLPKLKHWGYFFLRWHETLKKTDFPNEDSKESNKVLIKKNS